MQVWKFALEVVGENVVSMPAGTRVLLAGEQFNGIFVWAMCDPCAPVHPRRFLVVVTGQDIPDVRVLVFVGTVQLGGGTAVFHVFEYD